MALEVALANRYYPEHLEALTEICVLNSELRFFKEQMVRTKPGMREKITRDAVTQRLRQLEENHKALSEAGQFDRASGLADEIENLRKTLDKDPLNVYNQWETHAEASKNFLQECVKKLPSEVDIKKVCRSWCTK